MRVRVRESERVSETLFIFLGVAQWFCCVSLTTHRFFPSRVFAWVLVQMEACVVSVVGAGFVIEVSYFALWSITPQCFPSLSLR